MKNSPMGRGGFIKAQVLFGFPHQYLRLTLFDPQKLVYIRVHFQVNFLTWFTLISTICKCAPVQRTSR